MKDVTSEVQLSVFKTLNEVEGDWQQLKDATHKNPYQSYSWLKAWHETIGRGLGLEVVVAVARIKQKTVLILPLALQRQAGVRTLSFLGHQNGNQNTAYWDAEFYESVQPGQISSLLRTVCTNVGADLLALQNIPETWHGRPHPLVLENAIASPNPIFSRTLSSDFDTLFRETHSKSSRKNLLRKQRHLQANDDFRIVRAEDPEDLQRGYEAFLQQRSYRAAAAGIPNVFSDPAARQFIARLLGLSQDKDINEGRSIDLWYLETGGAIRSTYLCIEQGSTIYAYSNSVAHDDMLPNSPGLVLIKEIIAYACGSQQLDTLDLGLGEERYKTAWASAVPLVDCRIAMTAKGRVKLRLDTLRTDLKTSVRRSKVLWPLVRKMRKLKANLLEGKDTAS